MRRAAKIDFNQKEIVNALRQAGAFVQSLAPMGKGVLDLLVGYNGKWIIIEIKDGNKPASERRLTRDEMDWIVSVRNRAPVYVVKSAEEAIGVIRPAARSE